MFMTRKYHFQSPEEREWQSAGQEQSLVRISQGEAGEGGRPTACKQGEPGGGFMLCSHV